MRHGVRAPIESETRSGAYNAQPWPAWPTEPGVLTPHGAQALRLLTGKLMKGSGYGAIGDIVIGIVGAIVGGFIMQKLGYAGSGGLIYTVIVAIVGAVLLTLLLRLVTGNRARNL
ncbi:GlsB/YeaQ/YmgE family stress response membrane protein [Tunturiibacter gelidiferens]|uniref:GlsB/YeaQ/YmgE family stress response membrane protein n=1 Tax=Tunturiibacter gelidiferens TaxID=3069689 RepID=UPI003D9B249E